MTFREPTTQLPPEVAFRDFKGRPYTKAVPFSKTFSGAAAEFQTLWPVIGGFFELALLLAKSTAAGEYAVCDSDPSNVIGFIQFDGVNFSRLDLGLAGIRSNRLNNSKLVLLDPVGIVATVHGVAYGWEVTQEGNYR
jgi:hypothetical protein